jgi:SAM-dependent methyltransferase
MSLQDIDDLNATLRELARVLEPGGLLAIAVVHPMNSAGVFTGDEPTAPFVVDGSYLEPSFYADRVERDGMGITFVSAHRPLQTYFNTLTAAGFTIERVRETEIPEAAIAQPRDRRFQRLPLFLHILATRR